MTDHDDADWIPSHDEPGEPTELTFAGHDNENDMLHLTIPELAGARTLAVANASGSSKARRKAKAMAWTLIVTLGVLPLLFLIVSSR